MGSRWNQVCLLPAIELYGGELAPCDRGLPSGVEVLIDHQVLLLPGVYPDLADRGRPLDDADRRDGRCGPACQAGRSAAIQHRRLQVERVPAWLDDRVKSGADGDGRASGERDRALVQQVSKSAVDPGWLGLAINQDPRAKAAWQPERCLTWRAEVGNAGNIDVADLERKGSGREVEPEPVCPHRPEGEVPDVAHHKTAADLSAGAGHQHLKRASRRRWPEDGELPDRARPPPPDLEYGMAVAEARDPGGGPAAIECRRRLVLRVR